MGTAASRRRWIGSAVALLFLAAVVVTLRVWPHAPLSTQWTSSTAVRDAHGRLLRLTTAADDRYRVWIPLDAMAPHVVEAMLLHEDRWFHWHPGFNPASLLRGAWITYVRGGHRQGGSTLTMQLVRLLDRDNTRTPSGKLRQVARAIWLELRHSKREILEAYLNVAPFGRNIEGVEAASLVYFDKSASALSLPEALTLAVIPQDPSRRATRSGPSSARAIDARNQLYARWLATHPRDRSAAALFELPLTLRPPEQLPFAAPHLVERVLAQQRIEGRQAPTITTTLDLDLQRLVQRRIEQAIARNQSRGIRNASALLVDTRDMAVRALVGSADYFDASIAGQVDGTAAKRSPGSTLKPLLYALAIDEGVLHPLTILRDVPTAFGPFSPENFDGRFLGPVSATDALIRSRNIPAVQVASRLTDPTFHAFLRNAGISRLASERHYGLALTLGGGEVTMTELASLYAMLANRGEQRALRFIVDAAQEPGRRLLSPEASFMVLDMLKQNPRPDDVVLAQPSRLPVYWKTGTSWGFRDAWTAGVFGPYVLVVWIGNFDGSNNPAFIGVDAAAPLFFQIFDAIRAQDPNLVEPVQAMPADLARIDVCLASGDLPNAWCPRTAKTWFIPGKSPIRVSTVHRAVRVDTRTGHVACPPYDEQTTRTEVHEFWPSELARVFAQTGMPRRQPPQGDCTTTSAEGGAPRIDSPLRGTVYTARASQPGTARIALTASADADARQVYWFVDSAYVGLSRPGETLFWKPSVPGQFTVRAVDDRGRAQTRELRIAATQ